jgi:drug/metabolite transporter (DMT)-like permease
MRRGPLYMTAAGLMFTIMVSLVKVARAEMSAIDLMFWRGLTSVPLAYLFARRVGVRLHNVPLFAVRAAFGFCAMVGFFYATYGLAVANLSLIHKLHPIIVAIAAPLALGAGEKPGPFIWLLLTAGVAGTGLILAPDLAVGSVYGLFAVGATVFSAAAHVCIRGLSRTDDARALVLWFQAVVMVLSAIWIAVTTGGGPALPTGELLPYVLGIGVFATGGQLLMTQAYAEDRAPVVAAASYTTPIWGLVADLTIFSLVPGPLAIAGGTIIVSAGLVLIFSGSRARTAGAVEDG